MERFRPAHTHRLVRAPLGAAARSAVGAPLQLLRIADLCRLLRVSKPTLWRMRRNPAFPRPAHISPGVMGWYASEIEVWLASQVQRPSPVWRSPRLP